MSTNIATFILKRLTQKAYRTSMTEEGDQPSPKSTKQTVDFIMHAVHVKTFPLHVSARFRVKATWATWAVSIKQDLSFWFREVKVGMTRNVLEIWR